MLIETNRFVLLLIVLLLVKMWVIVATYIVLYIDIFDLDTHIPSTIINSLSLSLARSRCSVWTDSRTQWQTGWCGGYECRWHTGPGRSAAPSPQQNSTHTPAPQPPSPGSTWTYCDICPDRQTDRWTSATGEREKGWDGEGQCYDFIELCRLIPGGNEY